MNSSESKEETFEVKKEEKEVEVTDEKVNNDKDDEDDLDNDAEIVTMVDVLQEETELEDNADAGKYMSTTAKFER